ncbi:inovirus Gp2 family protein [Acidovorax sp. D2M1]|uniref:Inovirus Gp2 family protein n=2 Tax=Acidovorax benzenivorans TaxID=2987520 RepID=A0ABT5RZD8_9BURK|nr:inovirus Gp2 family protein [Acidovorax benzenivorans]
MRREHQRKRSVLVQRLVAFKQAFPKLMVLRLDLGYGKEHSPISTDRIIGDWEELKAFISTNFPSYLCHAVKLEYGLQKGAHMHVLLLFNGAMVRQDVTIAKLIGEHWSNVVTGGMGVYFNCNAVPYKNRFSHCGVGVFNKLGVCAAEVLSPDFCARRSQWPRSLRGLSDGKTSKCGSRYCWALQSAPHWVQAVFFSSYPTKTAIRRKFSAMHTSLNSARC